MNQEATSSEVNFADRSPIPCSGCGKPLGFIQSLMWDVCLPCVRARARTVARSGRCGCGRERRPVEVSQDRHRWISCKRCLGAISQLPDLPFATARR